VTRATTLTAFRDAAPAADVVLPTAAGRREAGREAPHDLNLRIHGDLANVEAEWRRFEAVADCTVFQTFDWLAAWHRHIGLRARVQPAVAVGRFADGDTAFIVPLCIAPHGPARRLCWLGQELCDYNAPLLARDFFERVTAERFLDIWREFFLDLATNPQTRQLVHVARLQVGADAVAANFGVVFGGCYYHVLASYCEDSRAAHFGPGALHLRELLKYAIERGLQRFDFTIGDERYKLEWCDSSLKLYDHAAAATWRGWPAARAAAARRRLKRLIKQTPWVWNAVSAARTALGAYSRPARP
jgi:CelD/BcsL family acetyltransferase involved in cellulose biosynthesis